MASPSVTSVTIAEQLAHAARGVRAADLPAEVRRVAADLLLDVAGLCVAARGNDYIAAVLQSMEPGGRCTAIGHPGGYAALDAALINGIAAHGEDYDDTFEGGPVHAGAVIVPAVLAAAERYGAERPMRSCAASRSAPKRCAGWDSSPRCASTKPAFIPPASSVRWAARSPSP